LRPKGRRSRPNEAESRDGVFLEIYPHLLRKLRHCKLHQRGLRGGAPATNVVMKKP